MLDILYEDEQLVAINKPAGLFVHRTQLDSELVVALQMLRDQIGQRVSPLHRLDRPTSGVLVFSKRNDVTRELSMHWHSNTKKTYLAICRGYTDECGTIDYAVENASGKQRQPAISHYETLSRIEIDAPVGRYQTARYSLVRVTPETGRMHQIRRHFKHIFHPLLGDTTYGDGKQNDFLRQYVGIDRLFLHAESLMLTHPTTKQPINIFAPIDDLWQLLYERFDWHDLGEKT